MELQAEDLEGLRLLRVVVAAGRVEVLEVFKECSGEVKTVVKFEIVDGVLVEMAG